MKKALIAILLFISNYTYSQCDSVSLRLTALENKFREINLNLHKANKQHQVGVGLITGGAIASAFFITSLDDENNKQTTQNLLFCSSLVFVSGFVVLFDSHKFIARTSFDVH